MLVGLVLNGLYGWCWADATAGPVIAGFAVREGIEAWRGDACASSVGMLLENEHDDHDVGARWPVDQRVAGSFE